MEKSWFSHTGMEGGLSLSLPTAFPFSASHSSCSQLCADGLEGDYLLWFTYTHCQYCIVVLEKWLNRWMCIRLLYQAVNASDFQTSSSQQHKSTRCFLNHQTVGLIPEAKRLIDCLLDYDFTCQCPHWTTGNTFTFTHSCSFVLLRLVMLDNSFCHHPISAWCNCMSCIKGKQNTETNLSKSWTFCTWKLKCYIF